MNMSKSKTAATTMLHKKSFFCDGGVKLGPFCWLLGILGGSEHLKESVRVSCGFLACWSGSSKYQTCLIFHQPFYILDPVAPPPPGNRFACLQLVTITSCLVLHYNRLIWKYFSSCHSAVAEHHSKTGSRTQPTILQSKSASPKQSQPDGPDRKTPVLWSLSL